MADAPQSCTKCGLPKAHLRFVLSTWMCGECSAMELQGQGAVPPATPQDAAVEVPPVEGSPLMGVEGAVPPAMPQDAAVEVPPVEGSPLMGVEVCASQALLDSPRNSTNVLITLRPPVGTQRTPVSIVCVVDTSGSMRKEASIMTGTGGVEDNGLSVLDVVKHAVSTVVASLTENDFLSIVCFSKNASVLLPLTAMNASGKAKANDLIKDLTPLGSTSLWKGLECGLGVLRDHPKKCRFRNNAVFLFTDGEPTDKPANGHVAMLKEYKSKHGLPGIVHTFGFGYNLDSKLLYSLAVQGNGAYAFIPDASMVGTVFIHSTANLLVGFTTSTTVTVEPLNGAALVDSGTVLGKYTANFSSSAVTVDLATMRYDQNKSIVLRMKDLPPGGIPYARVTVDYKEILAKKLSTACIEGVVRDSSYDIATDLYRLQFVNIVKEGMISIHAGSAHGPKTQVDCLANKIRASGPLNDKLAALLEDVSGQASMAFIPEFFEKWGRHYLLSLSFAHLHQFCNNFKDPGVQVYATGALFQSIRDTIDDIFCELPAPTPSRPPPSSDGTWTAPANMSSYHSSSNPCFSGDSFVLMADGSTKQVCQVRKGDWVCTTLSVTGKENMNFAKVICVTVSPCINGYASLVQLPGGLCITPWHPIRINGVWQYPTEVQAAVQLPCPAVFNFVLDSEHVMIINGVECVTLGHNFQQAKVRHDFFGSQRVIKNLQSMAGWHEGMVLVGGVVSDPITGLVCGLFEWATDAPCHAAAAVPLGQPSFVSIKV